MSYLDGKKVPGSNSPKTVWLRKFPSGVLGIDFDELNDFIREYNNKRWYELIPFWECLTNELHLKDALPDAQDVVSFDVLWNQGNVNMNKVVVIKSCRNPEDER